VVEVLAGDVGADTAGMGGAAVVGSPAAVAVDIVVASVADHTVAVVVVVLGDVVDAVRAVAVEMEALVARTEVSPVVLQVSLG
jgi:hypothetical protein